MQFRLRSLMIFLAVAPPLLAWILYEAVYHGQLRLAQIKAALALWPLIVFLAGPWIVWEILLNLGPVLRWWFLDKKDRK